MGLGSGEAWAQSTVEVPARLHGIDAKELDTAIEQVMRRPVYEWRFPRDAAAETEASKSAMGRWFEDWLESLKLTMKKVQTWAEKIAQSLGDFFERLGRRLFGRGWRPPFPGGPIDLVGAMQVLLWVLLVLALAAGLVLGLRGWWQRGKSKEELVPAPAVANWLAEEAAAAQLPQDEWLRMAEEFLRQGDRRLSLRALYLSALAGLAKEGWITLARHRSNREYALELDRRTREQPEVGVAFGEILGWFEPVWYGRHEASGESIDEVRRNLQLIRECVGVQPSR
jgi:hypothetical protein